ncbi:MAG: cobalamin biosynthesis protein CbiX, partial [Betaproteobacteria bacterium]|nr:cobalamin biosynthesis protein CbiX [Betaproteobacteria bacterium]
SMSPSLIEAAKAVTQQGAGRVVVVPLFLAVGGHIRKDLPPLMEAAARACGVPVSAAEPAGESAQVQSALAAYCLDAARSTA